VEDQLAESKNVPVEFRGLILRKIGRKPATGLPISSFGPAADYNSFTFVISITSFMRPEGRGRMGHVERLMDAIPAVIGSVSVNPTPRPTNRIRARGIRELADSARLDDSCQSGVAAMLVVVNFVAIALASKIALVPKERLIEIFAPDRPISRSMKGCERGVQGIDLISSISRIRRFARQR
jgi:hypothetical protein